MEQLDENICNRLVILNTLNTILAEVKNIILYHILGYIIRGIVNNLGYSHSSVSQFQHLKIKGV